MKNLCSSLLILSIFIFSTLSHASPAKDWQKTFYTDDSPYYLKLHADGFTQRFRLHQDFCSNTEQASLVLKKQYRNIPMKKMDQVPDHWPSLYGLNTSDYCWYEARVRGLDLNSPQENKYTLKITYKGKDYFYQSATASLLPENRFSQTLGPEVSWISLGGFGATIVEEGGLFFKLWEPEAQEVHLFLNNSLEPLTMIPEGERGPTLSHVKYVSHAKRGSTYFYRFLKQGKYESIEVANFKHFSDIKVDPMAKKITYDAKGGYYNGYMKPQGVVVDPNHYPWNDNRWYEKYSLKEWNNWIIYQLWPMAFNPYERYGKYRPGTFTTVLDKIEYLKELGVNTLQFLPVNESRFRVSWGYALDSLNAIEGTYGSPSDLKNMVDILHQNGFRIIFDVVVNHINNDLIRDPLEPQKQYSKFFRGNTAWGPRPDFSKVSVRKILMDSLLSLARDYHVDGFRFDMTNIIHQYDDHGRLFLREALTLLKRNNPRFFTSAEELPDNVTATWPIEQGGVGFDSQWNDLFKNFFELHFDSYRPYERWTNLYPLKNALLGFSDHWVHRNTIERRAEGLGGSRLPERTGDSYNFGPPFRTVNYLGSHDFVGNKNPFVRLISDFESFEYSGHNKIYRVRPLEDQEDTHNKFRLIHNDFTHSATRLAYGILFTKPGNILFFQGEELASDINIENEWSYVNARENNTLPTQNVEIDRYVGSHRMPWEYLNPTERGPLYFLSAEERRLFSGHFIFFKDMIKFRKSYPEINYRNATIVEHNHEKSILSYIIGEGENEFFVVANFGERQNASWIKFPDGGHNNWWREVINTSDKRYGGHTNFFRNIISNYGGRHNHLRLAPSSFMIFKKQSYSELSKDLYLVGNLNNWEARAAYKLNTPYYDQSTVDIYVPEGGRYSFKLATANWEIDLGAAPLQSTVFPMEGSLSYRPGMRNFTVDLMPGSYRFYFNLKTFEYRFEQL